MAVARSAGSRSRIEQEEESFAEQEDEEAEEQPLSAVEAMGNDEEDDYSVEKMSSTLLEISATIIEVKGLFTELTDLNP